MAVCARGSVLLFYAVFAGGVQHFFWGGGGYGSAVFQGRARMVTN